MASDIRDDDEHPAGRAHDEVVVIATDLGRRHAQPAEPCAGNDRRRPRQQALLHRRRGPHLVPERGSDLLRVLRRRPQLLEHGTLARDVLHRPARQPVAR